MPKNSKLAILRARHDASTPKIGDQACIRMLMTNQARRSVFDYWSSATNGYLNFVNTAACAEVDGSVKLGA